MTVIIAFGARTFTFFDLDGGMVDAEAFVQALHDRRQCRMAIGAIP